MSRKICGVLFALIVLCCGFCWGQSSYTVPLEMLNTSLSVPAMASHAGVVYVAYRSFDWLRQSDQLQVLSYDLRSRKVLGRSTIAVPKVRGARATSGLAISHDGATLAYVEIHDPSLILLISAKDLSEVRRSVSVPFTAQDHVKEFAGFDEEDRLSFSSINRDKPRFVRMSTADFKPVSDTLATGIVKTAFQYVAWNPVAGRFWLPDGGGNVLQYNEEGQATSEELKSEIYQLDMGAIPLGKSDVVAFFAMVSKGAVASYVNHKTQSIELPCSPRPYGSSNDHAYVGTICITQPDRLPEAGGDRVLTSEFMLIRADGPRIIWQQKMSAMGAGNNDFFGWATAVIEHEDKKAWVVAPSKSPELTVYEVSLPQ
jgi:hypothetical protein